MAGKLKSLEKSEETALVDAVCGSAHQIWQAGLGAFAKAREEGGGLFESLVQEGASLQRRVQALATDKGAGVTDTVTRLAENMSKQATGSWEKLEKVFEDRVSRSLRSLGVPSHDDIRALSRQIDELQKSIAELAGKKPAGSATRKAAAKPKAAASAKSAAKSTGAVKSAAGRSAVKSAGRSTGRRAAATAGHA
jgi:poly(hydroxyalkanoate) granule-associated protein